MQITVPCKGRFLPEATYKKLLKYRFQVKGGIGEDGQPWFGYKTQLDNCNGDLTTMRIDRNRWQRKAERRGSFWRQATFFAGGFAGGALACQAIND